MNENERLHTIAEAALGPESSHKGDGTCCPVGTLGCAVPTRTFHETFDPATVLRLLDTIDALSAGKKS